MLKTGYSKHDGVYQRKKRDSDYAGWDTHADLADEIHLRWQPLTAKSTFPKQGRLLELGCGAGNMSIYFAQMGYKVVGVDISPTAIGWAIENAVQCGVNAIFLEGNVLKLLEIADESFDMALDGRCFHCIIGSDRVQFLQETRRVLKLGGILALNTMCNEVPDTPYFQDCFDPRSRCTIHDGYAVRYIGDSNEILQEVMQAGFRVLDVEILSPTSPEEGVATLQVIAEKR